MVFGTAFIILIITSIVLFWVWLKNKQNYWKKRGLETPPCHWLWGHVPLMRSRGLALGDGILALYDYIRLKGWKHGGLYLPFDPSYMPVDLDIIKSIMQNDFQHFTDRAGHLVEGDPLSNHLLNLKGKKWKMMRSKLTPTFSSGKMKMMFEILVECTKGLEIVMDQELESPGVDIKDVLGRFTTDIIGNCAFGIECNSLEDPNNAFREHGKACFHNRDGILKKIAEHLATRFPSLKKVFKIKITVREISEFFTGLVTDTVEYREKNNVTRKDLMQLLIELKNRGRFVDDENMANEDMTEKDNTISLSEIAGQAVVFFEAGFETSSTAMTFCLYELAKNKHLQNEVRNEIREVLAKYNFKVTYDAIMDMPYLEKVLEESMRKYPPATVVRRTCTKTYKVPGTEVILEKGSLVLLPILGIHRDPKHYPDPEKFDPERFSEENKKSRHEFAYLAFGKGPRNCIGLRFGMLQAKIGIVTLLRLYEFEVSNKTAEPLKWDPDNFILATKGEIWLKHKKLST